MHDSTNEYFNNSAPNDINVTMERWCDYPYSKTSSN